MPLITSVEPQKKKKRRFNIFVDGQFAFGVDENLLVSERLKVGQKLSAEKIEAIVKEAAASKLFDQALNFLSYRARTEKEVRDYLSRKISQKESISFGEASLSLAIGSVILKLKSYKYLDDLEFAKLWIASRERVRPKGSFLLRRELLQKGISEEIVEKVIESVGDQKDLAMKAVEKKLKLWRDLTPEQFQKKIYEFLVRRGFDYQTVKSVFAILVRKR